MIPPFVISALASLGGETGKAVIKWGGIATAILAVIGLFSWGIYNSKKVKEQKEIIRNKDIFINQIQNEKIAIADHAEKERLLWQKRWKEANNSLSKIEQVKIKNRELAKDIKKSLAQVNCNTAHINEDGECHEGIYIPLNKK